MARATENGILRTGLASDISHSKQARIDIQYYVERELDQTSMRKDVETPAICSRTRKKAVENMTTDRTEKNRSTNQSIQRALRKNPPYLTRLERTRAYDARRARTSK
jgi:hypothetical protein